MKAEPLKNKTVIIDIDDLTTYLNELKKELGTKKHPMLNHYELYGGMDIKSAVEWLKIYWDNPQQLIKDYPPWREDILQELIFKTYNHWIIVKAFEDVIKK